MSEPKNILDLLYETEQQLADGAWPSFLQTAGQNYKYDFPSQVLIYAQKPDATACADMDTWNKKLHRQVREDVTGITLLSDLGAQIALRQVFDVSDTISPYGHPVPVWQMAPEKEHAVRTALIETFLPEGIVSIPETSAQFFRTVADTILTDHAKALASRVEKLQDRSPLLGALPYTEAYQKVRLFLLDSMTAAMMHRCNLQPQLPENAFQDLSLLQDIHILATLGQAIQEYTKQCLDVVCIAVRIWDRIHEEEKEHAQTNLSKDGSVPHSGTDTFAATLMEPIRDAAQNISDATANARGGDGKSGRKATPTPSGAQSSTEQSNRTGRMGSSHDKTPASGGGSGLSRDDLSLKAGESMLLSPEEQRRRIHSAVSSSQFIQEDLDSVLTDDFSGQIDRSRLFSIRSGDLTAAEMEQATRDVYANIQADHVFPDGVTGFIRADQFGITAQKGRELNTFTWSEITGRTRFLIDSDRYLAASVPESKKQGTLEVGKRVQLSSGAIYTILRADKDTITLQDTENPLFTRDMPRQVLEIVLNAQKSSFSRNVDSLYTDSKNLTQQNYGISAVVKGDSYTVFSAVPEQNQSSDTLSDTSVSDYFAKNFDIPSAERNYSFLAEYAPEVIDGSTSDGTRVPFCPRKHPDCLLYTAGGNRGDLSRP